MKTQKNFSIEVRKLYDTVGRSWSIIGVACLVIIIGVASSIFSSTEGGSSPLLGLSATMAFLMVVIPVFTVIHFSYEYSNRSAQTTFLLEPNRRSVWFAKLCACLFLAAAFVFATVIVSVIANFVISSSAGLAVDMAGVWGLPNGLVSLLIPLLANVLVAAAVGSLVANLAGAVITYMAFFLFADILFGLILRGAADSLSYGGSVESLQAGDLLGVSTVAIAVWTIVPLIAGALVFTRREVS